MNNIWDPANETMARPDMLRLQLDRLEYKLRQLYETVPFYRQALRKARLTPDSVRAIEDISKLPFTTKQDFRDNYPFGLLAIPPENVVRMQASGGTTGKPTLALYSAADVELWSEMMARTMVCGGLSREDRVHVAFTYGLFTGGLGFHYGAERVGAAVIPASSGQTKRQIMLMQDLGSTVLCATPSYALFLAETALEMGVDLRDSSLRLGFFGAEPWTEQMRTGIESKLGVTAIDTYGLSEVIGPGVSGECHLKDGLHIQEDHFLPEIVDPVTGEPLPHGTRGELVLTALTREALPVVRYRTGDITSLNPEPCACGRTLVRMEKVTGRTDDMLIVRGINVFPSQIEAVLLRFEGIEPEYQIIVDRARGLDDVEIRVEVSRAIFTELSDEVRRLENFERAIHDEIESLLGINARVRLAEPGSLGRSEGKAVRVVDRRGL